MFRSVGIVHRRDIPEYLQTKIFNFLEHSHGPIRLHTFKAILLFKINNRWIMMQSPLAHESSIKEIELLRYNLNEVKSKLDGLRDSHNNLVITNENLNDSNNDLQLEVSLYREEAPKIQQSISELQSGKRIAEQKLTAHQKQLSIYDKLLHDKEKQIQILEARVPDDIIKKTFRSTVSIMELGEM